MKTEVSRPFMGFWQALSEVPGWPDAPISIRLRRLWPLALPLVVSVGLLTWSVFVREPHRRAVRLAHAELIALDQEVEMLRQDCSDLRAAEIVADANKARAQLFESPAALSRRLEEFGVRAAQLGWESTFQLYGVAEEEGGGAEVGPARIPARLRLTPRPDNVDRFNTMIATLAHLALPDESLETTRLVIRRTDPDERVVEVNIRATCRSGHEKNPQ